MVMELPVLWPDMDRNAERRILGLIGLGLRARNAVVGVEQVRVAARRGRLALAIVAPDASRHSREKVLPILKARRVRVIEGPTVTSLGAAAGRDSAAAIGILDYALARGIVGVLEGASRNAVRTTRSGSRTATAIARPRSPV
jgi:ribosomal protein L7Ae-like RNA K-turn-binding protein